MKTVDEMRFDLAEKEAWKMMLKYFYSDITELRKLLLNGFEGLDNIPDIEIRDEWNNRFGESEKSS